MPEVNLYLCSKEDEVQSCLQRGVPALLWKGSTEDLWKYILYPVVKHMFPEVNIPQRTYPKQYSFVRVPVKDNSPSDSNGTFDGEVTHHEADVPDGERLFNRKNTVEHFEMDINRYIPDLKNYVDVNLLADLKLLPKFMGELASCIRTNLIGQSHREGYNKKLKACVGNCNGGSIERNLLIVDVSYSMGAIGTLLIRLVDSLRGWCNADLIITGAVSRFYPYGTVLPEPERLRRLIPPSNESFYFNRIILEDLKGKSYTNVISFGDNDTPSLEFEPNELNIKVKHLWNYHNDRFDDSLSSTGYAKWVEKLPKPPVIHVGDENWSRFECE